MILGHTQEIKELKVFACEGCGYELMPARGREGKFFANDFKCPICGAPKEKFWDINDPKDPRNQVRHCKPPLRALCNICMYNA